MSQQDLQAANEDQALETLPRPRLHPQTPVVFALCIFMFSYYLSPKCYQSALLQAPYNYGVPWQIITA